jgi:hypothetical protein
VNLGNIQIEIPFLVTGLGADYWTTHFEEVTASAALI